MSSTPSSDKGKQGRNMSIPDKDTNTRVYDRDTDRWRKVGKFTEGPKPGKNAKKS